MISRRDSLALLGAAGIAACTPYRGPADPIAPPASAPPALRLDPLVDIVSGVGLQWLVQAKPREFLADDELAMALQSIVSPARVEAFAQRYGGVDVSQAREVVLAGYSGASLALARVSIDPARIEAAFSERAIAIEGRAVEADVVRLWGSVDGAREQIAIFGRQGVALESGRLGPLRAAVYFAQGKLHRSQPALHTEPLATVAQRIGEAPLRGFAPGPFEGAWAAGLGGLLRAATAAAGAARLSRPAVHAAPLLRARFVLAGNWGADAAAAGERFAAAFRVLAEDPVGRLLGVDRPLEPPHVSVDPTALALDVALEPFAFVHGLRAATGASLPEILGLSAAH
jgi:hypothetical protein